MPSYSSMVCRVAILMCLCWGSAFAQSAKTSAPGSFLSIDGSQIYFEECGTSPQTVAFLHDGVLHSAAWDDVWPEFCKHFHTIRYDRRGYGQSPAATAGYFATDDLATLLHHLKTTRAAIVGSSHGKNVERPTSFGRDKLRLGICWFKTGSTEHISRISEMVNIL